MSTRSIFGIALSAFVVSCVADPGDSTAPGAVPLGLTPVPPRAPVGIIAKVDVADQKSKHPNDTGLAQLYHDLLANPAVSGVSVSVHWEDIPYVAANGTYDWTDGDPSTLGAAFTEAEKYSPPKTVQVNLSLGAFTPQTMLDGFGPCDELFASPPGTPDRGTSCGTFKLASYPELRGDHYTLPLPWSHDYKVAWKGFIASLDQQYPFIQSIEIAGPTASSAEMLIPNDNRSTMPESNWTVDGAWEKLFAYELGAADQDSDQIFVDEWNHAIDQFNRTFCGITLELLPDSGTLFPEIGAPLTNTLSQVECAYNQSASCAAVTSVMQHLQAIGADGCGGTNAIATQSGGMTASSATSFTGTNAGDVGIYGDKYLTTQPATSPVLAGSEFDHPLTDGTLDGSAGGWTYLQEQGCTTAPTTAHQNPCKGLTAEQGLMNTMLVVFDQTRGATAFGAAPGDTTIQFLGVPAEDIEYATAGDQNPTPVCSEVTLPVNGTPRKTMVSAQYLLDLASHELISMVNTNTWTRGVTPAAPPPPTCTATECYAAPCAP